MDGVVHLAAPFCTGGSGADGGVAGASPCSAGLPSLTHQRELRARHGPYELPFHANSVLLRETIRIAGPGGGSGLEQCGFGGSSSACRFLYHQYGIDVPAVQPSFCDFLSHLLGNLWSGPPSQSTGSNLELEAPGVCARGDEVNSVPSPIDLQGAWLPNQIVASAVCLSRLPAGSVSEYQCWEFPPDVLSPFRGLRSVAGRRALWLHELCAVPSRARRAAARHLPRSPHDTSLVAL